MIGPGSVVTTHIDKCSTFDGSVRTSSAPKACNRTLLSRDMDAGMVRISLYPLAAATKARPMPVLPDVGSTRVVTPAGIQVHQHVLNSI